MGLFEALDLPGLLQGVLKVFKKPGVRLGELSKVGAQAVGELSHVSVCR